jgi:hypothetical protein
VNDLAGLVGLIITIVVSSVGACAWLTTRLTRIETKMENAFERIAALEARKPAPPMRVRRKAGR